MSPILGQWMCPTMPISNPLLAQVTQYLMSCDIKFFFFYIFLIFMWYLGITLPRLCHRIVWWCHYITHATQLYGYGYTYNTEVIIFGLLDWEVQNYDATKISKTFQKIIFWLVGKIHLISCQKLNERIHTSFISVNTFWAGAKTWLAQIYTKTVSCWNS